MNFFAVHTKLGLSKDRAGELEEHLLSILDSTGSVSQSLDRLLALRKVHGKSISRPERDYLLLCMGIYMMRNQISQEQGILHNPDYSVEPPEEDDDY